jgi:large subunit ribosomal protein L16
MMNLSIRTAFLGSNGITFCVAKRGMKWKVWPSIPQYKDVQMPEMRKLPMLDPVPNWGNVKPMKSQKRLYDMQGPELVHNTLMYKQYGIIALSGGQLKPGHMNMIRNTINRALNPETTFATWRIEAPWKPITKKGQGKRMGGGKGNINHYVTPVRAGRVIVEVGGHVEFEEVAYFLQDVVFKLPLDAMCIQNSTLEELRIEEQQRKAENINPINFERAIKNNLLGCKSLISPYDEYWFGKYI